MYMYLYRCLSTSWDNLIASIQRILQRIISHQSDKISLYLNGYYYGNYFYTISRYSSMPEANASLNIEWLKKKLFKRAHL